MCIKSVNNLKLSFKQDTSSSPVTKPAQNIPGQIEKDSFESQKENTPTKISNAQLFFNTLTNEQIEQINRTKELPQNAALLFVPGWKTINKRWGNYYELVKESPLLKLLGRKTRKTLPEGYKLKRVSGGQVIAVKTEKN